MKSKKAIHQRVAETEANRRRVVWGEKNDGCERCEEREMKGGGQADRLEDREV